MVWWWWYYGIWMLYVLLIGRWWIGIRYECVMKCGYFGFGSCVWFSYLFRFRWLCWCIFGRVGYLVLRMVILVLYRLIYCVNMCLFLVENWILLFVWEMRYLFWYRGINCFCCFWLDMNYWWFFVGWDDCEICWWCWGWSG